MLSLGLGLGSGAWHLGVVAYSLLLVWLLVDHVMRKRRAAVREATTVHLHVYSRDMDDDCADSGVAAKLSCEPVAPLRAPDADLFVHEERDSEPPPNRFVRRTRSGRIYSEYCW